jgi:Protein-disulfide isomerase
MVGAGKVGLAERITTCEESMQRDAQIQRSGRRAAHSTANRLIAAGIATVVALSLSGCTKDGASSAAKQSGSAVSTAADADFPAVLATVGNEQITMKDIRERSGDELDRIQTQYNQLRSKIVQTALDSILGEKVIGAEAKKQGKTVEQLVTAEGGASLNPSEADIAAWYAANPDRTGGRPLDQIRQQISDYLRNERMTAAAAKLQDRLNKEHKVAVNFQPYRLSFDNASAPKMGKDGAPVTLVEFSDFQCPFCHRFAPTLKQVEQKYGDKVQIVYRQYPIASLHPFAFKAAEASLCAQEQGKFWEMHDAMFGEQTKLGVADLKQTAVKLGMDKGKFDKCIDTGRYVEQVQKDMADGTRVGVNGTPAVFINGTELKGGAVPFSVVSAAIDKELARAQKVN